LTAAGAVAIMIPVTGNAGSAVKVRTNQIFLAAAVSASLTIPFVSAAEDETGQVSPIAVHSTRFLGSAYSASQSANFTKYWNKVTPENAGKWGSAEPERDVMRWEALDAAWEVAKANDLPFHLHVLVWGNQQPAWIEDLAPAEQLEEISEWF